MKKILLVFFLLFLLLAAYVVLGYQYRIQTIPFKSGLSPELKFFIYNESKHNDPVKGCWYDAGDYLVFSPRDALSTLYLSIAYKESSDPLLRQDLTYLINRQLDCLTNMHRLGLKQFRDKDNHGINIPPFLNSLFYPNGIYKYKAGEGKDVTLILSLIYKNMGDISRSEIYKKQLTGKITPTMTENCCEAGPLSLSQESIDALSSILNNNTQSEFKNIWGIQPAALFAIQSGKKIAIQNSLDYVNKTFTNDGAPFQYLGGNYDIAGTIALEKMYAKQFNDNKFTSLSEKLMNYLAGNNTYKTNFAAFNKIYHPCSFFFACDLTGTLVNGVDSRKTISPTDKPWNVFEPQIVGQAEYVLAKSLH